MNKENLQIIISLTMGLTLLMGLMAVGGMDAQDDVQAEAHYCKMVNNGHWGAYRDDVKCVESLVMVGE